MFTGSTVEALKVARAVHAELDHDIEITLWNQNVFEPGNATWLDLITQARSGKYDLALLVLGSEDQITSRGTTSNGPRDNCLLELGLFSGAIGPDRTFFLIDRDNKPKIATDLLGITALSYGGNRSDGNLQSAVGPACEQVRQRVEKLKQSK
jgi:predicted nucleotide-binding protein